MGSRRESRRGWQGRGAWSRRGAAGLGLIVWLAIVVTGCVLPVGRDSDGAPVHIYVFNPRELAIAGANSEDPAEPLVLLVNRPQARGGFDTPRMAFFQRPYEIQYYARNQWADTPARMLAPLLVQALEKAGAWQAVVAQPSTVRGDYGVDSELLAAQQEFFQTPSAFRLRLRVQLVDLRTQRVVGIRGFEALEVAPSEDAAGGVEAANRALSRLLGEVAEWLRRCTTKGNAERC